MEYRQKACFCCLNLKPYFYTKIGLIILTVTNLFDLIGSVYNCVRKDLPPSSKNKFHKVALATVFFDLFMLLCLWIAYRAFKKRNFHRVNMANCVLIVFHFVYLILGFLAFASIKFGRSYFEKGPTGLSAKQQNGIKYGVDKIVNLLVAFVFIGFLLFFIWRMMFLFGIRKLMKLCMANPEIMGGSGQRTEQPRIARDFQNSETGIVRTEPDKEGGGRKGDFVRFDEEVGPLDQGARGGI